MLFCTSIPRNKSTMLFYVSLFLLSGNTIAQATTQAPAERASVAADQEPGRALRTFRTYFVKSGTIYMKAETLKEALERRPEFAAWGVRAVGDLQKADVIIEVTLPFLTWEWNYKMTQSSGGAALVTGKVKALTEDITAPQLAAQMAERIKVVRVLPESTEQTAVKPAVDGNSEAASPNKEWKVEFLSGPSHVRQGKGTLTISQDGIICQTRDGASFTILAKDLVAVEHNTEKNHVNWADIWEAANPGSEMFIGTLGTSLIALPVGLVGGVIVEAWPAEQLVRIDWRENGVLENLTLKVSDYKALLKEITLITHKVEIDISAEAKLVHEALTRPDRQSWFIRLDRQAWVGWKPLSAGEYELVFMSREYKSGAVYFVLSTDSTPGGIAWPNTARPVAHAVVQVEDRACAPGQNSTSKQTMFANVQYKVENGMPRISEISKEDRVWLFTFAPLKLEPVPEAKD